MIARVMVAMLAFSGLLMPVTPSVAPPQRHCVTTYFINATGQLQIESVLTEAGRPERTRFQVFVRYKEGSVK